MNKYVTTFERVGSKFIAIIAKIFITAALVLSASLLDNAMAAENGVYAPSFTSIKELGYSTNPVTIGKFPDNKGFLYDESSLVRGTGEISVRNFVLDSALDYSGWLKGTGSMNLETLRSINKKFPMVNFSQKSDLIFEGGLLSSSKSLEAPRFYKGIGASVNEWFNLTHLEKSENEMIRSVNRSDNTLVFNSHQAFEGIYDIKDQQGWLLNAQKSEQRYSGSFQTQKEIEFRDLGKK